MTQPQDPDFAMPPERDESNPRPKAEPSQPAIATDFVAEPSEPEIAYSQPAIAGGAPFLWWEHRIDLNARALIREAMGQETLNWQNSVVDLLTLAGQGHSVEARRWMAKVLNWPGATPDSPAVMSPEMNAWLCTRLKAELVKHGGKLPESGA
jgi:hypothetical protein